MTVLLRLDARVRHTEAAGMAEPVTLAFEHHPADPPPAAVDVSLDFLDVLPALQPQDGDVQVVLGRVTVEGLPGVGNYTFEPGELLSWEVETVQRQGTLWRISLPASSGDHIPGPLLYERTWKAPPPGLLAVHIDLVYLLHDGTEATYRLVTDGLSIESTREYSPEGHLLSISGLGAEGRYDRKRVSLQLPAGHGRSHGQLIAACAQAAGVPSDRIAVGREGVPRYKAVDLADEELRPLAAEIAEAAGYDVRWQSGQLELRQLIPPLGSPVAWRFTEADLVATEPLIITAAADVPTCFLIEGTAPAATSAASAEGLVITSESSEVYSTFQVPGALSQQDNLGNVLPLAQGGPAPAKRLLERRTTTVKATRGGCPLYDDLIEEGWHAPEARRYFIGTDGQPAGYFICWLYGDAQTDDGTAGYAWPRHRFGEIRRTRTAYLYDEDGRLVGKPNYHAKWMHIEQAVKERTDALTAWEDLPFIDATPTTGSGRGVVFESELYLRGPLPPAGQGQTIQVEAARRQARHWASIDDETVTLEGGYQRARQSETTGWDFLPGWRFLRHGGSESDWPQQAAMFQRGECKSFHGKGENSHQEVVTPFGLAGAAEEASTVDRDGYLPAAEVWDPELAERSSARSFEGKACGLEATHIEYEERRASDWVESEDEAEDLAELLLRDGSSTSASFAVPVNGALQDGQPVWLEFPAADVEGWGWVRSVVHSHAAPGDPVLTRLIVALPEV